METSTFQDEAAKLFHKFPLSVRNYSDFTSFFKLTFSFLTELITHYCREIFSNLLYIIVIIVISSDFEVKNSVKQGCVLAPILFGIFFSLLLKHAFKSSTDGVEITRLRAKSKTRTVNIRDLLYADDAALVFHSEDGLQRLLDRFSNSCDQFGITISLKKTRVMGQATPAQPLLKINGENLDVVHQFQYLASTVTDTLSLDV